jgi:Kef-type K+ transport system membrane component KefB
MNDIFLLAILTYLVMIVFGRLTSKYLHIPWMFTVVVFSIVLSSFGLFKSTFEGEVFQFLARTGMLFFLFTIGVDLELDKIKAMGKQIVIGDIVMTLGEGLVLGLFFYLVFPEFVSHSFPVALVAGIAFGTVGEVALLAVLKEFGLEKTRFGQLALGIGVFDDLFEMLALGIVITLASLTADTSGTTGVESILKVLVVIAAIALVTFLLVRASGSIKGKLENFQNDSFVIPALIFLIILSFFYFSSLFVENLGVIAAIFSGIAVQKFMPEKFLQIYKKQIYFVGSMFLGPFFFLSLGSKISFESILTYPLLILTIILITLLMRVTISYLFFRKLVGKRQSLVLGVGLSNKFSTSVVSENILFTSGLMAAPLYSAIMASFILLKPIVLGTFSRYLALIRDQVE